MDQQCMISKLNRLGYTQSSLLTTTLQGCIYKAVQKDSKTNMDVVIKIVDRKLHDESIAIVEGASYKVQENVKTEVAILKYLTMNKKCPDSIVKYVDFVKSTNNYYYIMEYGGTSLFDFVKNAHELIENGSIDIPNWQNLVRKIFKQMIECIEYCHAQHVCHMDVSLENWLITDVRVRVEQNKVYFEDHPFQIKLCDFGLAQLFKKDGNFRSNKHVGKPNYYSPEVTARKSFNAASNDLFCTVVCLFMMLFGCGPWLKSSEKDRGFIMIMNGQLSTLLTAWNRYHYANDQLMQLFQMCFKYENQRADLKQIQQCSWLRDN